MRERYPDTYLKKLAFWSFLSTVLDMLAHGALYYYMLAHGALYYYSIVNEHIT